MPFNSSVFIWIFFPIVFLVNLFLPFKWSNIWLLICSLFFYAWAEPVMILLLMAMIVINWLAGYGIEKIEGSSKKRILLWASIAADVGILIYWKYIGETGLPIGLSFYTFQTISYIADIYKGRAKAQTNIVKTGLYISFFPKIMAGPIEQYCDAEKYLNSRKVTYEKAIAGFRLFIYGLGKKILIANVMGKCADSIWRYGSSEISGVLAWIAAITYTLQIYYDFSGYSDMAIGLGRMFGFEFKENFNYPYLSSSITEFWRRWHISLGTWFREYVYIPLGGNRGSEFRTYINLLIVFLLTGIWHGSGWNFVVWGLFHGALMLIERAGVGKILKKHSILGNIYCILMVAIGWIMFRSQSITEALNMICSMFNPMTFARSNPIEYVMPGIKTIVIGIMAFVGSGLLQQLCPVKIKEKWSNSFIEAAFLGVILLLCMASIASGTYNPFIYFRF